MRLRICPDVVPCRSLSTRQIWLSDDSEESEEKKSYPKESERIRANKEESGKSYESYLRLEPCRDSNSYRYFVEYGSVRKNRLGENRDMPAFSGRGRREPGERESMAAVSRIRRSVTIGRL